MTLAREIDHGADRAVKTLLGVHHSPGQKRGNLKPNVILENRLHCWIGMDDLHPAQGRTAFDVL